MSTSNSAESNAFKTADKGLSSATTSKVLNEVYGDRSSSKPPCRPADPHYVGQDKFDTATGLLDLYNGKTKGAETQFTSSLSDLKKESTLISTAQKGGESAIKDLASGNKKDAVSELDNVIKGLDKNYYNNSDDKDFEAALKAAKAGNLNEAGQDAFKAEAILKAKGTDVGNASTQMQTALQDVKNGDKTGAETAATDSVNALHPGETKPKAHTTPAS